MMTSLADVDADARGRRTLLDLDDAAFELIAGTELPHRVLLLVAEAAGIITRTARCSRPSRAGIVRVGEEELLAVDLVVGDRLLAVGRDQPVDQGLPERRFD